MDLVPFFGEQPLTASNVTVRVRSADRQHARALVERTSKEIKIVNDEDTYTAARRAAAQLKGLSKEIYQAKRAAKTPFETVEATIEDLAKELMAPVDAEQQRIIELMTGYVRELERKQKAALRALQEKLDAEERAHQEKIKELEAKNAEAARLAQLERDLELETRAMTTEPPKGVVPGGRITHPWKFKLLNAVETVKAGDTRLLRIELDILACQDSVRSQLEIAPDKTPTLPGIEVTQDTSITIKPISRIQ
jgi:hypothetical protein